MPVGLRTAFRIRKIILPSGRTLWRDHSPVHSSDSDETCIHKRRYMIVARRTLRRWYRFVFVYKVIRKVRSVSKSRLPLNAAGLMEYITSMLFPSPWPLHPASVLAEEFRCP